MKIAKIIRKLNNRLKMIKNHPLARKEIYHSLLKYITFHLNFKDGEEVVIPFCGNNLINLLILIDMDSKYLGKSIQIQGLVHIFFKKIKIGF